MPSSLNAAQMNNQERALAQVFHRLCGSNLPFLPPRHFYAILNALPERTQQFTSSLSLTSWNDILIRMLLSKGLNPVSLQPAVVSARWCVEALNSIPFQGVSPSVIELGTGAGWSTLLLYHALRQQYGEHFSYFAVDASPYALAATSLLLEQFGVPYQIAESGRSFKTSPSSCSVVLCRQDFVSALRSKESDAFTAIYSNHGIAYVSPGEQKELLGEAYRVLQRDGMLISDSLNPQVKLELDQRFVFFSILRGRNLTHMPARHLRYKQPCIYEIRGKMKIIRALYDEITAGFLDWIHYLIFRGKWKMLKQALRGIRASETSQQILRQRVVLTASRLQTIAQQDDACWNVYATHTQLCDVQQTVHLRKHC